MSVRPYRFFIFLIAALFIVPISSRGVKIVTWNILDFPGSSGEGRIEYFRKIIEALDPDILVVQDMLSSQGADVFLKQVMNHSSRLYKKGRFFDGPDSDNAVFYNKKIMKLISRQQIPTALRDISEYYFRLKKGPGKGTKFRLYSCRLKGGTSSEDKQKRADEAKVLRNYLNTLPPDSLFVVAGDFSIYSSLEEAFKVLTGEQSNNNGRVIDPVEASGSWHDKKANALLHTQSTHKKQKGGFVGGGLDDRFDLFLISTGLAGSKKLTYKPGSYSVFGNDGKHFNKSVVKPKNKMVSAELAEALYEASSHLPVVIELEPYSEVPEEDDYVFLKKWGGTGTENGKFQSPIGIALDSDGNIYVAELTNNRIQKFSPDGSFITKWGQFGIGNGQLGFPAGIAVDQDDNVYVVEYLNNRVQKFTSSGEHVAVWGSGGFNNGQFSSPSGIAIDQDGKVYVCDSNNNRVQIFSAGGKFLGKWSVIKPSGIAIDKDNNVYIPDVENNFVQKFKKDGTLQKKWGVTGSGEGHFDEPIGVAVDEKGDIYITEMGNDRVQKFTTALDFVTMFGSEGTRDGRFKDPTGIAVDAMGHIYVVDTGNSRIQKFGLK